MDMEEPDLIDGLDALPEAGSSRLVSVDPDRSDAA